MTFPAQLSTSYNLLCHIHKQNGKDQIFGKNLKFFSLRTSIKGDFFYWFRPKSSKCSLLKKGKFELKLPIFSVRYLYFHFFSRDFAISNT